MDTASKLCWDTGDAAQKLSIGSHELYLAASGCDRKPGEPIVLLMQGMGSTIDEWVAVRKLVTPFARWVNYDRSGLGRSDGPDPAPESISAVSVATELDTLLKVAGIAPPFIIVCHSWGGFTAREFFHLRPHDVAGMVFVDCNNEYTWEGGAWGPEVFEPLIFDQNWVETTGLAAERILSDAEWKAVVDNMNSPRHRRTEAAEGRGSKFDRPSLMAKQQLENQILGNRPVSVIMADTPRDFQRMCDVGIAAGHGTDVQRALCRERLERLKAKHREWLLANLTLSRVNHHVEVDCGHNVQMIQPEAIAKEISWVLDIARRR